MHSNRPFSLFPKGVRRPSLLELKRTERKDPHPLLAPTTEERPPATQPRTIPVIEASEA
ncbi:hypothetical protein V6Z12_A11G183800 [Gossypium hirsutum]